MAIFIGRIVEGPASGNPGEYPLDAGRQNR